MMSLASQLPVGLVGARPSGRTLGLFATLIFMIFMPRGFAYAISAFLGAAGYMLVMVLLPNIPSLTPAKKAAAATELHGGDHAPEPRVAETPPESEAEEEEEVEEADATDEDTDVDDDDDSVGGDAKGDVSVAGAGDGSEPDSDVSTSTSAKEARRTGQAVTGDSCVTAAEPQALKLKEKPTQFQSVQRRIDDRLSRTVPDTAHARARLMAEVRASIAAVDMHCNTISGGGDPAASCEEAMAYDLPTQEANWIGDIDGAEEGGAFLAHGEEAMGCELPTLATNWIGDINGVAHAMMPVIDPVTQQVCGAEYVPFLQPVCPQQDDMSPMSPASLLMQPLSTQGPMLQDDMSPVAMQPIAVQDAMVMQPVCVQDGLSPLAVHPSCLLDDYTMVNAAEFCSPVPPPPEREQWDVCWQYAQKGWCPRGSSCRWAHTRPQRASSAAYRSYGQAGGAAIDFGMGLSGDFVAGVGYLATADVDDANHMAAAGGEFGVDVGFFPATDIDVDHMAGAGVFFAADDIDASDMAGAGDGYMAATDFGAGHTEGGADGGCGAEVGIGAGRVGVPQYHRERTTGTDGYDTDDGF